METNLITDEPLLICEFQNVRSRNPRPIRFGEFMERVCSPAYKEHVQNFRQLAADEATRAEAQRVKGDTPCVVITGNCREGHKVEHLVSFSGLLCIDLDHTDGRTAEIIRRVQSLPWVMAAFRSISGKGVKVVARVSTDDMRHRYAHLYAAVGSAVSACAEHPYDEKCKILTQPCYYSWDPAAWYAPEAEVFLFVPAAEAGSDADAALHYLAEMLESGEDVRFIARRIVICAAEDVGNADPMALVVANAAAQAAHFIGLPEAQLPLAQAVCYIANAPKSNACCIGIFNARADAKAVQSTVSKHLRDAHYPGAKALGHGTDYKYPHDYPGGWVRQQYMPDELVGRKYYFPKDIGAEKPLHEKK